MDDEDVQNEDKADIDEEFLADKAPKKRGGGGAWRAFTHLHARGKKISGQTSKQLAALYAQLSPEEKQQLVEVGRKATECHRLGSTTFPLYSRRAKFSRGKPEDRVLGTQTAQFSEDEEASLDARVRSGVACALPTSPQRAEDRAVSMKASRAELQAFLKQHSKVYRDEQKKKELAKQETLEAFAKEAVERGKEALQSRRLLQSLPWSLFVSPQNVCDSLVACFDGKSLPSCWDTAVTKQSLTSLTSKWGAEHKSIRARDWKGKCAKVAPKSRCHSEGCCVCNFNAKGAWIRIVHARTLAFIKRVTSNDDLSKALQLGELLLQWQGVASSQVALEEPKSKKCRVSKKTPQSESKSASVASAEVAPPETQNVFAHIALHYKTPYRQTLVQMKLVQPCEVLLPLSTAQRSNGQEHRKFEVVRSIHNEMQIFSLSELLATLDEKKSWHCAFWRLSSRAVGCELDGHVVAHPLELAAALVWTAAEDTSRIIVRQPLHSIFGMDEEESREHHAETQAATSEAQSSELAGVAQEAFLANQPEVDTDEDSDVLLELDERPVIDMLAAVQPPLAPPHPPPADFAPRQHELERPGAWGVFRFSRKMGSGTDDATRHGSFEVTCPFHLRDRSKKSLCKKTIRVASASEADQAEALRLAKVWACQAQSFKYQYQHVFECSVDFPWTFAELEGMRIDEKPENILDDAELWEAEPQEEKDRMQRARGRGRGRGRGSQAPRVRREQAVPGAAASAAPKRRALSESQAEGSGVAEASSAVAAGISSSNSSSSGGRTARHLCI